MVQRLEMGVKIERVDGIKIRDGGGGRNDRWYRGSSWGWRQKW